MGSDDVATRDFDALIRAAGMTVPPEWRRGTIAVYRELRVMASRVRAVERSAWSEPAGAFDIAATIRAAAPEAERAAG